MQGATVRSSSNDSTSVQTGDDKDAPQEFTCNRVDGAIEFFSSETNGLNNMTGDRRHGLFFPFYVTFFYPHARVCKSRLIL